jgi:hypothetical protein
MPLKIKSVSYVPATSSVMITLAKPYKGPVQVVVQCGLEAMGGATNSGPIVTDVPCSSSRRCNPPAWTHESRRVSVRHDRHNRYNRTNTSAMARAQNGTTVPQALGSYRCYNTLNL